MKLIVILIFLLSEAFDCLMKFLNYKNRKAPIPQNVSDVYDKDTYKKRNEYEMENTKFFFAKKAFFLPIYILIFVFNVHSILFNIAAGFSGNVYIKTFFMYGVLILIVNVMLGSVFKWYDTFKIEAKYGFNKTTSKTFVGDIVKEFIFVTCLLAGGFLALFMFLYFSLGNKVFFIFFFVLASFIILASLLTLTFLRLFNKFTPLDEGTLKDKIFLLAEKAGYPVKRIYTMDASKRSTKLNAFFTGFGKRKTIVLFDTLIEKLSEDEIAAVLAHEIGHSKYRHVLKNIPFALMQFGALLFAAQFFIGRESISFAFGFTELNVAFGVYIFLLIAMPFLEIAGFPQAAIMRKFEREADMFAAKYAGADNFISALKQLSRENYQNLTPHPLVVKLLHSHPTVSQRIEYLANF